jgi:hypothetical protein
METMDFLWKLWTSYGNYGLPMETMDFLWKLWTSYGNYGIPHNGTTSKSPKLPQRSRAARLEVNAAPETMESI